MASKTIFLQSFDPFSKTRHSYKSNSSLNRVTTLRVRAMRGEAHNHNSSGRIVDESMIVLRKRIHEMKMIEADCDLPSEWMDWEKQVYASYDSIICDAMGHLQTYLMETRPSLALGVIALVALSVSTTTVLMIQNLLGLGIAVMSRIHLA